MTDTTTTTPPVKRGPGRPRNPTPPRNDQQAALAVKTEEAEARLDLAQAAYAETATVAVELEMLRAEMSVASAWASYCRAQNIHATALKYAEDRSRLAGRVAGLRELLAADELAALKARAAREDALRGKGKGRGRGRS